MQYQLWQHTTSGEVWAVMLDGDGEMIGSCGPLGSDELHPDALAGYDYTAEDNDWFADHDADFTLATPSRLSNIGQ